jgi:hypothetical protein
MKNIFLFCSKLWVYLTELPVIFMLVIAVRYNESSEELLKLYPLITFLSLVIIFIAVYFFRVISVSAEEIRYHGLFSSKDSALITKDKTLYVTLISGHRLKLELFGDAGEEPAFEWMREEDVVHRDISLFRGKAIGGEATAERVLKYFGMPEGAPFGEVGYRFETDDVIIATDERDEGKTFSAKFKTTVL